MERAQWRKQMRSKVEALYDRLWPDYWVTFGGCERDTPGVFSKGSWGG